MYDHTRIITGLVLSCIVAFIAFFGNWITLDAIKGVIIFGTIVLGFAGWIVAAATIFFFVTGSLLTRKNRKFGIIDEGKQSLDHHLQKRRDGYQIWANGFWIAIFCIGYFLFSLEGFLVAAYAAIATATADTWATEIGTYKPGKTKLITTFREVEPGRDGGISLKGTLATIVGALAIALFVIAGDFMFGFQIFIIVLVFGVLGSLTDSVLGALLTDKNEIITVPADFSGSYSAYLNSLINWISIGFSGLLALFTTQLMF